MMAAAVRFDMAMLAVGGIVLALEVFVLRRLLAAFPRKALALLRAAVARWTKRKAAAAPDWRVQKYYEEQRLQSFQKYWKACIVLHGLATVSTEYRIAAGGLRWMTDFQTCLVLSFGFVFAIAIAIPNGINTRNIPFWHCMVSAFFTFFLVGAQDGVGLPYTIITTWICRMFICMASGCGMVMNFVWFVIFLAGSWTLSTKPGIENFFGTGPLFLLFEFNMGIFIMLLSTSLITRARTIAAQEVRAGIMQGESAAMNRMLGCLCDCSFELDGQLRFRSDVPTLASILASHASAKHQGSSFKALLANEDDKARFEAHLARLRAGECEAGTNADVETVTLRDALGQGFKVDVYFVRYELFSEEFFLIGLRECGDHTVSALRPMPSQLQRRVERLQQRQDRANGAVPPTAGSAQEADAVTTQDSEDPGAGPCLEAPAQAAGRGTVTTGKAMRFSVTRVLQTWTVPDTMTVCCKYHAAVTYLERITEGCRAAPCQPQFYSWRSAAGGGPQPAPGRARAASDCTPAPDTAAPVAAGDLADDAARADRHIVKVAL